MTKCDEVGSRLNQRLAQECRTYARYLAGVDPSEYVQQKYAAYHARPCHAASPATRFDRFLINVSRLSRTSAALVDTYSSHFCKQSAVRRKLVLLTAILECSPPTCEAFEKVDAGGTAVVCARLAFRLALYGITCTAAAIMLGPLHLLMRLVDDRSREAG